MTNNVNGPTLYKIDTMGRTRIWWMEYNDTSYRAHSGLEGGKIVTSGWQYPDEKNVGKVNATTVAEQVASEVQSKYQIQLYQKKYHNTFEEAKGGAKFIECMLANKYDPKKHKAFPYFSQPKLDGGRCIASVDGLQTRNGKEYVSSPHVHNALGDFFERFPNVIVDGELYNHDLKDDFEKIMSLVRKSKPTDEDLQESEQLVRYYVYDVILEDEDATYSQRMKFIQEHLSGVEYVVIVPTVVVSTPEEVQAKLGEYLEEGYEGQMLRVDAKYEHKRSSYLLKDKTFEDEEFVIVDMVEGTGKWAGRVKSITIQLPDGSTQSASVKGNFASGKALLENRESYIGTDVTIQYQNKTSDNKLRFPVASKFWKGRRDV